MSQPITCIVLDDEPLAVELMTVYVNKTPFLQLQASFTSAMEALEWLRTHPVDLIFCDIQMPDLNGLEFSRMIPESTKLIFTTAFDQYAVEGFKVNAVDYLLKPIRYSDFLVAANKALSLITLLKKETATQPPEAIFVKSDYQLRRVELNKLLYIEGLKDYVKIYLQDEAKPLVCNLTLKSLEERLPQERFMRVHRSYIVQLAHITTIERNRIVFGKTYIPISDSCKDKLYSLLSLL